MEQVNIQTINLTGEVIKDDLFDGGGKIKSELLPSYVDDVVEYNSFSDFPATGESGKIYVAKDTGKTYRWSGSQYTLVSSSSAEDIQYDSTLQSHTANSVGQKLAQLDEDIDNIKDGTTPSGLANNLSSWAQRSQREVIDEWSDKVRTTAGSLSIDSSKNAYILHIESRGAFYASALAASGENLLNPSAMVGGAYVFQVPKLLRGSYGNADEANGILFVDNNGNNLNPSVRFCATYPTSASDGTAVTPYQFAGHSEWFYPSSGEGWFIVSGLSASAANVCARIAWSKDYNKYVAYQAPSTVSLSAVIAAIASTYTSVAGNKMLSVGGGSNIVASEATFGASAATWIRKVSAVQPTWTNTKISEEGAETDVYRHTATIPSTNGAMKADGLAEDLAGNVGLHVEGTTVYYDDSNATSSVVVKYELAAYVTGSVSQTNTYSPNDMGVEALTDAQGAFVVRTSYFQAYPDTVAQAVAKLESMEESLELINLTQPLYIAGAWLNNADNATNTDKDNADAIKIMGNKEWALNWIPCLFDMTPVTGEVRKLPIGQLKKNNWLRFIDGTFAPVIGITQAMYDECMANALYTDAACTQEYCASGVFNAETYYTEHCSVVVEGGRYKLSCAKLYKSANTEVTHYLMPWETKETKYSIFLCRKDKVYCADNLVGASGKEWNGVFGANFNFWDGEDIGIMPLEPTGIAPSPVTAITENSVTKLRSFFFNYSSSNANCNGRAGSATNCQIFLGGGHYPLVNTGQQTFMAYAWSNNADTSKPYPNAEAGYHAHNTFLKCIECAYGTKYLAKNTRFSSGVSSNDTCNSEATWKLNGGVRWKKTGDANWSYSTWGGSSHGIYKNASGGRDAMAATINNYNLHSMTCQDQIAVSFATELNIPASAEFEFCSSIFRYENIVDGTFAPTTLANGKMNCRVYKVVSGTFSAYNSDGTAQSFDVECLLRTGLMEGCNASGDGGIYRGGGAEIIGLCTVDPSQSRYGNQLLAYVEPDQTKWVKDSTITNSLNTKFLAEKKYRYLGSFTPTNNFYVRRHIGHSFLPKSVGSADLRYGESSYAYMTNYWGSIGQRVRLGLRFGVYASSSVLSPRFWDGIHAASITFAYYAGSAQLLVDVSNMQ